MLMGTGGNAGGQSSATIIRGIALNEISMKDYFKVWVLLSWLLKIVF